ncbi:Hypothetical protein SMAX5B_008993 [Scophthalmus maximus]|uniref:Uncharacterized protein n=1 Tax=Scophthalmus maximus TaxID=52904 RepID=A0A2U9CI17_SCOMX|nr:Hypothetical protein SMAX5B_008993 [Scophthalmus maximus]KAF0043952.1 hypothetical protein F2P81_003110 [Scophthalmus maximus]
MFCLCRTPRERKSKLSPCSNLRVTLIGDPTATDAFLLICRLQKGQRGSRYRSPSGPPFNESLSSHGAKEPYTQWRRLRCTCDILGNKLMLRLPAPEEEAEVEDSITYSVLTSVLAADE